MDTQVVQDDESILTIRLKDADADRREKARTKLLTFFDKLKHENPEVIDVHWTVKDGD